MDERYKTGEMINLVYHIKNSGLSIEKLSVKTGITEDRIMAILENVTHPTMSDIRKFSKALKLSIDFLISDNSQFQEINLLFRQAIRNENDKFKADKFSHIIGNTFSILENYISPTELFNKFPRNENTYQHAESLADLFRSMFLDNDYVSPMLNLPRLLADKLNCIIYVTDIGVDVDGASAMINNVPFIFISERFPPRMLFTLAHELGHILAHHNIGENFAVFDKKITTLRNDTFIEESFSNAFASCLLLPKEGVGITLKKIREHFHITGELGDIELLYLSRIYGVSFEVAGKRCEDLDLLPSGGAISLYEKLKAEHESPEKRAKEIGIQQRPNIEFPRVSSNLIYSAIKKINSGEVSLGKASEILSMPIHEIINIHLFQASPN
jgi:Zn-dependent peptidase ImmA (M78 family)